MKRGADNQQVVLPGWENLIRTSQVARASMPSLDDLQIKALNARKLFPEIAAASKISRQWKYAIQDQILAAMPRIEIPSIVLPKFDVSRLLPQLEAVRTFNAQFLQSITVVQDHLRSLAPALDLYVKAEKRCSRLEKAGWLPHHSTPWALLDDEEVSVVSLNEAVEAHYRENWNAVRTCFEDKISVCAIDDEAKATFREALTAHEMGLYRCVARTLFPEVERVSCVEIHNGALDRITGQAKLKDAISELYPGDLAQDGITGMRLYAKLMDHLYANLTTPEKVDVIAADPVPNRHAAVHGHVSYNTLRHSVNALIIGEYLLHAISVIAVKVPDDLSTDMAPTCADTDPSPGA